ncbi:(R)-citramalate synthase [Methanobrevibacter sp. DSM 116169]|uniref:(R)-citramalate synthase n=1 Tax=Methanobrevibacter sp. DSM 116169 TaxID=3242727 RepID=UPI0038FC62B5
MKVKVLDTTLRDGEQTPGVSLTKNEKLRIASKLDEIGVNFIEAGAAVTSEGEREAIKNICAQGFKADILSFSRPIVKDIDYCIECNVDAVNLVVPTSDLHITDKLKTTHEKLLQLSNNAIEYCKDHGLVVELSAEDASRSDLDFLETVFKQGLSHGADRLCFCDTVGVLTPKKSFDIFSRYSKLDAPLSVHCHNDFGLAVANTLAAIRGGASEFHSTINGIGERAGNTSFEEMVSALYVLYGDEYETDIKMNELYSISKLSARLTGVYLQPNKAIVGENAFAHESGIHSDGIIKNAKTYEPMTPELVGHKRRFIVGKHVGTKGLKTKLLDLDLKVNDEQLKQIFKDVKSLADKGKTVSDVDLQAIAENILDIDADNKIKLIDVTIVSGNSVMPTASVKLDIDGNEIIEADVGIGPVDAAINAVNKALSDFDDIELVEYHVDAITGGTDAIIDVIVRLKKGDRVLSARSARPDIINASVEAYISGINRLI